MALTTILASYRRPDDVPERGWVEFQLVPGDYEAFETAVYASPVRAPLNEFGDMQVDLVPSSGTGAGWDQPMLYQVTERIKRTQPNRYFIDVPTSATPLRLGDLTQWVAPPPPPPPGGGGGTTYPSSSTYPSAALYPG